MKIRKCPICKQKYSTIPALSRRDNKTEICTECGIREALYSFIEFKKESEEKMLSNDFKKEMKEEAIKRMKILKLHKTTIKEFEEYNKLNKSTKGLGILFWLTDEEKEIVEKFEKKHNVLVYHVIETFSNLGHTYDLLFVSKYKDEWDIDNEDLKLGYALSKTEVVDYDTNSESGYIGIQPINGGVARVC